MTRNRGYFPFSGKNKVLCIPIAFLSNFSSAFPFPSSIFASCAGPSCSLPQTLAAASPVVVAVGPVAVAAAGVGAVAAGGTASLETTPPVPAPVPAPVPVAAAALRRLPKMRRRLQRVSVCATMNDIGKNTDRNSTRLFSRISPCSIVQ